MPETRPPRERLESQIASALQGMLGDVIADPGPHIGNVRDLAESMADQVIGCLLAQRESKWLIDGGKLHAVVETDLRGGSSGEHREWAVYTEWEDEEWD